MSGHGLPGAEQPLGERALREQGDGRGDVGDKRRERVAAAKYARGQSGGGVRGSFEPNGVRVVGRGGEAGGIKDQAVDGFAPGQAGVRGGRFWRVAM